MYSSIKKVSYYIYMTRSKRRNENGKRRSTRRKTQRGAGKMMQSALSSLAKIRKTSEELDNQIDIIINNNYTFSNSTPSLPTEEETNYVESISDAEERFKKAQEINKVQFKNKDPIINLKLIQQIQVATDAAKQYRKFSKNAKIWARARLKLLSALSLRRTIKKTPAEREALSTHHVKFFSPLSRKRPKPS